MSLPPRWAWGIAIVAIIVGAQWSTWTTLFGITRATDQRALRAFFASVQIGASEADVRNQLSAGRYSRLRFQRTGTANVPPAEYLVWQPAALWGENWSIRVRFAEGRVVALRVRLLGSCETRPRAAPPDRGVWPAGDAC